MMGQTHRPMGSAWWLGGIAAANLAGAGINPVVALTGAAIAPVFAAGRLSPDADLTWLRHLGHRRLTHRPDTTAVALTAVSLAAWVPLALVLPFHLHLLLLAPVTGWWSHLVGDAIFGRIPCGRVLGAVLRQFLGRHICPLDPTGRYYCWFGLGWDTDGALERGHTRWGNLPFAPATAAVSGASLALSVLVSVQWVMGGVA